MSSISSILVPLDGSSFAEMALSVAVDMAQSRGSVLRLVTVREPIRGWDLGSEYRTPTPELDQEAQRWGEGYLATLTTKIRTERVRVEWEVPNGEVAETLVKCIRRTKPDLVVMTSHGRGGIGRLFLGNVADEVVRRVSVPILILRPYVADAAVLRPGRILVPLDGSELAASILEQAKAFARATGAELVLMTVIQPIPALLPPFVFPPPLLLDSLRDRELRALRYLEEMETRLRGEGFRVQSLVRVAPKVAKEILALVKEKNCTMITLATHGASGLDRLMFGSVADQILRHSTLPVLLLHPREDRREDLPPLGAQAVEGSMVS